MPDSERDRIFNEWMARHKGILFMNPDELTTVWRSQDLSPLYGVDKNLLHQMLWHEQAKVEKQRRNATRFMYVMNAFLLTIVALFFAILTDPNQPATISARLTVWDDVVGVVGIAPRSSWRARC